MKTQIKKILYATDLSQAAPKVFKYAIFLANQFGAHITSLHVQEELSQDAKFAFATYFSVGDSKELIEKRELETLNEMKSRVERLCCGIDPDTDYCISPDRLTIKVTKGYPEEQILDVSQQIDADIIVMGAHEKGLTHTFLGTVAKRVLRRSRIPVIIVPLPDSA